MTFEPNLSNVTQAYLESRHPGGKYCIYNACRGGRLSFPRHVQVTDACRALWPTPAHRAPLLAPLYALLQHLYQQLGKDERQAAVITCPVSDNWRLILHDFYLIIDR